MSEKERRKKDGEDKNKKNQRMREANNEPGEKTAASTRHDRAGSEQGKG